ncbi:MAG: polysaccharide deacetylase family protein [Desulfobacterales bacterium]|nr:MAG: polysaccharide deacetylase family protein [Desulfobacterales bacterium]
MMKSFTENLFALMLYYSGLIKVIRDKGRPYAKILAFHSVSNDENYFVQGVTDIWISVALFVEQLSYIRKYYNITSLQGLVESLQKGEIQERSVVITFDDGFADNYHFVYPILENFRIPATIFLTTEAIDNRKPIWIQKLNYLINKFGIDKIVDSMKGLLGDAQFERSISNADSSHCLHKQIEQFLAYKVPKEFREEILLKLYAKFNISLENIFSQNEIFLSWKTVKKMHGNGICFGNHGESHTPFAAMSVDDQRAEIVSSKNMIEKHIKQDFLPFAYPFGQQRDFARATKRIIDEAGHSCILTAMPTLVDVNTSLQELGRIVIGNIPVYRLAYELEKSVLKSWLKL